MKKVFAVLLTLAMMLSLSFTALAEDSSNDNTSVISATDDHTYKVYQIFTGDLAEDGVTLSNLKWGKNAKLPTGARVGDLVPKTVLEELVGVSGDSYNDQDKLAIIEKYVDFETEAIDTVTSADAASVPNGYYLLKDLGVSDGEGGYSVPEGQEYSEYVTKIVKNVEIEPKKGETTTQKKVDDKNDTTGTEDEIEWQDSADYDIGDAVPFQLKATITQSYANYQTYFFAFHDTESAGLTFDPQSVVVKVGNTTITNPKDGDPYYVVKTTGIPSGETFVVEFPDLKEISNVAAGSVITVEYTSTLNTSAKIGELGNPNTMYGEYSNNPNSDGRGTTPEDKVIVFTYEFDANKVAKNPNFDSTKDESESNSKFLPLEGAGFTLYKQTGMTKAEDGEEPVPTWTKIGDEVKGVTTFSWKGIDDGTYKLVESTTPDGYNTMADIVFDVTAEHEANSADPKLTKLECSNNDFNADFETGLIDGDIENVKGTVLPETGGIGTTIFYVLGGVLLVGAAVLLITKKRMSAKD